MLWVRRLAIAFSLAATLMAALSLYIDGRFPAAVPEGPPTLDLAAFAHALDCVDRKGNVDLVALTAKRGDLDAFVASLARTGPTNRPQDYATPDAELAYWLNAYHALLLQLLLDAAPSDALPWSAALRSWPIAGQRLTLRAIEHRHLEAYGDARVHLARWCARKGCAELDGAPFLEDTLSAQLNDAARRFMRSPQRVRLKGKVLELSPLFERFREDFVRATPTGTGSVLQVVWAFLPDSCDERPGCDTRGDLDRACGVRLDGCTLRYLEDDARLTVK